MPKALNDDIRAFVAALDRAVYVPEKSVWNSTGYVQVIEVKGRYQARLQVPGDGPGGERKRKQCSLPCMFDTAEEAAVYLAWVKAHDHPEWENGEPPKMTSRKPRSKKPLQPAEQPALTTVAPAEPRMPLATCMAVPINVPMLHAPFVAVSPVPMPRYTPPFAFPM